MKKFNYFFWWCSGSDKAIIEEHPTEVHKYVGIGATVFFTGVFAAIAAAYALYTVFDSYLYTVLFGLLWGLMIFNLDRYIVSGMRKKGRFRSELWIAMPRIFLAVLISIVIARPLELKIFEKEIESELAIMEQEEIFRREAVIQSRFMEENTLLRNQIKQLQAAIDEKARKHNELRRIAREEADGTGGSKRRNAGPIYQIKKADADRAEAELLTIEKNNMQLIAEKQGKLDENDSIMAAELYSMVETKPDGLASRLEAMSRLAAKSEAINLAHWFILLLFIMVESAPVLVKLIAPRGPYDFTLNAKEYSTEAHHYEALAKINSNIKQQSHNLSRDEAEFVEKKLRMGLEKNA